MTFGQIVAAERKQLGLTQKDLAVKVKKEDGTAISPQYLNDIERDRRSAPSGHLIGELALALNLDPEYLFYVAGQFPPNLRDGSRPREDVEHAFFAFRQALESRRR
jgi:transcriptional regulator with XRE-family HTH domain